MSLFKLDWPNFTETRSADFDDQTANKMSQRLSFSSHKNISSNDKHASKSNNYSISRGLSRPAPMTRNPDVISTSRTVQSLQSFKDEVTEDIIAELVRLRKDKKIDFEIFEVDQLLLSSGQKSTVNGAWRRLFTHNPVNDFLIHELRVIKDEEFDFGLLLVIFPIGPETQNRSPQTVEIMLGRFSISLQIGSINLFEFAETSGPFNVRNQTIKLFRQFMILHFFANLIICGELVYLDGLHSRCANYPKHMMLLSSNGTTEEMARFDEVYISLVKCNPDLDAFVRESASHVRVHDTIGFSSKMSAIMSKRASKSFAIQHLPLRLKPPQSQREKKTSDDLKSHRLTNPDNQNADFEKLIAKGIEPLRLKIEGLEKKLTDIHEETKNEIKDIRGSIKDIKGVIKNIEDKVQVVENSNAKRNVQSPSQFDFSITQGPQEPSGPSDHSLYKLSESDSKIVAKSSNLSKNKDNKQTETKHD
jgi:hypothetical protein